MKFRIAKACDAAVLARIHIECGKIQVGSFMHRLGPRFLTTYYRLFLREKSSVIVIAEDNDRTPLGFSSGTLDAKEHIRNLGLNKLILALAMAPALIVHPTLLRQVLLRNRFVSSADDSVPMLVSEGPRGEYWAWRPNAKHLAGAVMLRRAWCNVLSELGCRCFRYELDSSNSDIEKFKQTFGCIVIEEMTLPDGRKRVIVEEPVGRVTRTRNKRADKL